MGVVMANLKDTDWEKQREKKWNSHLDQELIMRLVLSKACQK